MNHSDVSARQNSSRITSLFIEKLGYTYLGNWKEIDSSISNEEQHLLHYLTQQGYNATHINQAIHELKQICNSFSDDLYQKNKKVYALLRQGIPVKGNAETPATVVKLINWQHAEHNNFGIAEEVNIKGGQQKPQDLVLYVNGIALGVVEIKASAHEIGDGIKQIIASQQGHFSASFFSTVQLLLVGNEHQGLRYGAVKTEERFFQKWNEAALAQDQSQLDQHLIGICAKQRLLDLIYAGLVFDGARKKIAAAHHYFALKAANANILNHKGGMIWHPPGSGKNTMVVLLVKSILEEKPNAQILILSDKTEFVEQLESMFAEIPLTFKRAAIGKKLIQQLHHASPRLLLSLAQKMGKKSEEHIDDFIQELEISPLPADNELYVFVDECHRTQSVKLHLSMKTMLLNAIFIGFTETPLLKKDKKIVHEVFGDYVHTYKQNEYVEDEILTR